MTALAPSASIAGHLEEGPSLAARLIRLGGVIRRLMPYLAIEILLPGGTLLALLLWVYRRKRADVEQLGIRALLNAGSSRLREHLGAPLRVNESECR